MIGTFWAFVPAILAIVLALITKQVYISLFAGIFLGAMFLAEGNPIQALGDIFGIMSEKLGDNAPILVFLVVLGMLVVLMSNSGGSKAYGNWASSKIKSRKGALLATSGLGALIFVDDYFNCLTVGNVMRPVTDKFKISRSKLAYIIDATAAPICIIAPISSWAAAITAYLEGDGLIMFIKTIPFNLYALLTILMVIIVCVSKFDLFKMRKNEMTAFKTGDLHAGETDLPTEEIACDFSKKGKVLFLVLPIVCLIVFCVGSMIYTGYFYDYDLGKLTTKVQQDSFADAFAHCNSGLSLAIGSTLTLVITIIYYGISRAMTFKDMMESFTKGFKSMVPAILILTFAWTLSGIMGADGGGLNASEFVNNHISADSMVRGIMPAVFFILAGLIAFATGTSWGTFAILIPISTAVLGKNGSPEVIMSVSAILAGAVFGDHISPISDTTILASSGAQCNHIDHVKTQLPYALTVAIIAFVSYIAMGFIVQLDLSYGAMVGISFAISIPLFAIVILVLRLIQRKLKLDNDYNSADVVANDISTDGDGGCDLKNEIS